MFETSLCELAFKYGSDKCPQIKHHYTPFYFKFLQGRNINKIFEIGIGDTAEMSWTEVPNYVTGASLLMWRDFFQTALVYGMDIKESCLFKSDRIETFLGDQTKAEDLRNVIDKIGKDIDLVIDDGTHKPDDQIFTCKILMPLLQRDVIYVIEDVGHPEIIEKLNEYFCEIPRFKHRARRDDRLVIVRNRG